MPLRSLNGLDEHRNQLQIADRSQKLLPADDLLLSLQAEKLSVNCSDSRERTIPAHVLNVRGSAHQIGKALHEISGGGGRKEIR